MKPNEFEFFFFFDENEQETLQKYAEKMAIRMPNDLTDERKNDLISCQSQEWVNLS